MAVFLDSDWAGDWAPSNSVFPLEGPYIQPKLSWDLIRKREALLAGHECLRNPIPIRFPAQVSAPSVLAPQDLDLAKFTYALQPREVEELEAALNIFQAQYDDLNDLSRASFPLPTLGPILRKISADIHSGHGIAIVKGLDPDKYTLRENVILFAGLAGYIGDIRGTQSGEHDVLTHLRPAVEVPDARPTLMRDDLPFHNDNGEILSLYVVQPALQGGNTMISSAGQVYNEIASTKPHLVSVLAADDWPHWTARRPIKVKKFPILFCGDDKLPYFGFTRYSLTGSETSPRPAEVPHLTALQADAMDTIELAAIKNSVPLPQRKGDIHFISNRAFFHSRTAYSDVSSDRPRHLMRLILTDSELSHPLAPGEKDRWGPAFDFPPRKAKWILEEDHSRNFVSSTKFDSMYLDESTHSSS